MLDVDFINGFNAGMLGFRTRMTIKLNAFHVYAHELPCQMKYGPRQAKNWGLSDGEGNERDWSDKRHLVGPGRCSSSARQRQILSAQSLYSAQDKRQRLPGILRKRFQKLQVLKTKLRTKLKEVYALPLDIPVPGLGPLGVPIQGLRITVTLEFIRKQIQSKQEIFNHRNVLR
ncbi:hypothetical protein EV426DRAFT_578641 [Tirmania nivea]|nr:hypothetical protein EV426DRAFT_578641 [Tirmania nivea]